MGSFLIIVVDLSRNKDVDVRNIFKSEYLQSATPCRVKKYFTVRIIYHNRLFHYMYFDPWYTCFKIILTEL